jgi:hypothetical protein
MTREINPTLFALCATLLWVGTAHAQRFVNNGDGTLSDTTTGLMWELKTGTFGPNKATSNPHDVNRTFSWSVSGEKPDGTAFTDFLGTLNNGVSRDGRTTTGCFANHCDWRLPSYFELRTIFNPSLPYCTGEIFGNACVDKAFFPTVAYDYWSATTLAPLRTYDKPDGAWPVDFSGQRATRNVATPIRKDGKLFVRAVRNDSR